MSTINWDDPHADVAVCTTHAPPSALEESCADCVAEFNERNEINAKIGRKVLDIVNNLQAQGTPPPPWMQTDIRLNTLIEMLLDPRGRVVFEATSGVRMHEALKGVQQQVTRSKLAGGNSQGGLLVPGR